jgi:hypothetical protein
MLNVVMLSAVAPSRGSDLGATILSYARKNVYEIDNRGQCYKTFNGRKLRLFIIS